MTAAKLDKPIQSYLMDFGLSEKEVVLYLTLLKTGPSSVMDLARATGIKRSTTHNNMEELVKKGLVSQTNYGERRMIVAEDPRKLKFLMDQKKWEVKKLEENLPDVVSMINAAIPQAEENSKVEVKYYEGEDNIRVLYNETSESKNVYSFVNLDKYYEVFKGSIGIQSKAIQEHKNRNVWDIVLDTPLAREISLKGYSNYNVKFMPTALYKFGFDILIYDDKIAMIQLEPSNVFATIIDSKPMSETMIAVHKTMWAMLK